MMNTMFCSINIENIYAILEDLKKRTICAQVSGMNFEKLTTMEHEVKLTTILTLTKVNTMLEVKTSKSRSYGVLE